MRLENDGVNIIDQDNEASSMSTFYRRLLALRRSEPARVEGAIERVASNASVLTYERRLGSARLFIALNMAGADVQMEIAQGTVVLSSMEGREGQRITGPGLVLAGDEGIVIRALEPAWHVPERALRIAAFAALIDVTPGSFRTAHRIGL